MLSAAASADHASSDVCGWQAGAVLYAVLLLLEACCWQELAPGLALHCGAHLVFASCILILLRASHGLAVYARRRELLVGAAIAHHASTLLKLVLSGGLDLPMHHGGGALWLLVLLLGSAPTLWPVLSSRHRSLLFAYLLPAWLAIQPVWLSMRCQGLLQDAGLQVALSELHRWIDAAHGASVFSATAPQPLTSAQMCFAINAWAVLAAALARLLLHKRGGQGAVWLPARQGQAQPDGAEGEAAPGAPPAWWPANSHGMHMYMLSCLLWTAITNLTPLLWVPASC